MHHGDASVDGREDAGAAGLAERDGLCGPGPAGLVGRRPGPDARHPDPLRRRGYGRARHIREGRGQGPAELDADHLTSACNLDEGKTVPLGVGQVGEFDRLAGPISRTTP